MNQFNREERYIVLKLSRMTDLQRDIVYRAMSDAGVQGVDSVVVEQDWPEYEPTWRAIEDRMNETI